MVIAMPTDKKQAKLTGKQQEWLYAYLETFNATEAARRAGYKNPNLDGPRNLSKPALKAAIDAHFAEHAMSADEVLFRLTQMAKADMGDFVADWGGIDLRKAKEAGKLFLVKKMSVTEKAISVELHDSQSALEKIGKALGLFQQQHTHEWDKEQFEQMQSARESLVAKLEQMSLRQE